VAWPLALRSASFSALCSEERGEGGSMACSGRRIGGNRSMKETDERSPTGATGATNSDALRGMR
jgi:hypothetical protein